MSTRSCFYPTVLSLSLSLLLPGGVFLEFAPVSRLSTTLLARSAPCLSTVSRFLLVCFRPRPQTRTLTPPLPPIIFFPPCKFTSKPVVNSIAYPGKRFVLRRRSTSKKGEEGTMRQSFRRIIFFRRKKRNIQFLCSFTIINKR